MSIIDSHLAKSFHKMRYGSWRIAGRRVTKEENDAITDAVSLLILSTRDLIGAYAGDACTFVTRAVSAFSSIEEMVGLAQCLKSTVNRWRNIESSSIQDFVSAFSTESLLFPILPCVIEFSITRSVPTFQIVHHYLTFLSKIPLANPSLSGEAIDDYLSIEDKLSELVLDDEITSGLRRIVAEWFSDFHPVGLPEHSSGSTADAGPSVVKKHESLGWDEMFLLTPEWNSWFGPDACRAFSRTSKVQLVPKTALSLRTISMEPATLQYWQKPVLRGFERVFHKSELRFHVDLNDQTKSRSGALMASASGDYSTLDLKAASDSVSTQLVDAIFPYQTLRFLAATRSSKTLLPDGNVVTLKKFAPMGSSICFPMECTIFSACCEYVSIQHRLTTVERRSAYTVYGDDIIIRNDLSYDLMQVLEKCGFSVNTEKSFTRNSFRESCGVFAYKGEDITTPQLPRDHQSLRAPIRTDSLSRMIDLCNRFLVSGMPSARLYVLYYLPAELPFTQFDTSFLKEEMHRLEYTQAGLWTFDRPTNYRLRSRLPLTTVSFSRGYTNETLCLPGPVRVPCNLQKRQFLIISDTSGGFRTHIPDPVRLEQWLRSAADRSGDRDVISIPLGEQPRRRLRKVWQYLTR